MEKVENSSEFLIFSLLLLSFKLSFSKFFKVIFFCALQSSREDGSKEGCLAIEDFNPS